MCRQRRASKRPSAAKAEAAQRRTRPDRGARRIGEVSRIPGTGQARRKAERSGTAALRRSAVKMPSRRDADSSDGTLPGNAGVHTGTAPRRGANGSWPISRKRGQDGTADFRSASPADGRATCAAPLSWMAPPPAWMTTCPGHSLLYAPPRVENAVNPFASRTNLQAIRSHRRSVIAAAPPPEFKVSGKWRTCDPPLVPRGT